MSYEFSLNEVAFLRSAAGGDALRAVAQLTLSSDSWFGDVATARRLIGERAAAALETVVLRRKAAGRLDIADEGLFTEAALQQATPSKVAEYRAERLRGRDVHDVTCSIGADLIAISKVAARCVGSDLDPVRLAMARHNCAIAGVGPLLLRADALRSATRNTVIIADPARRDAAGRRKWRPDELMPPLDELVATYSTRELGVKCSPGLDFAAVPWAKEIELVSLNGKVREACLWTGSLATVQRRATVLRNSTQWTLTDAEADDCPLRTVGEWIIDPDGAVIRAGLVRQYAARHGLGQLDPQIAYLTGDTAPPGMRAFRVLEHGHYSEKALRAILRRHHIGRLEILVRGLDIDPSLLRPRLKLAGENEATVVLTRIGRTPMAFFCRAEQLPTS